MFRDKVGCTLDSLTDIPAHYELDEARRTRRAKDPCDVFVLVKEYISSTTLSQPPMLVLPAESKATFPLVTDRNLFPDSLFLFPYLLFFLQEKRVDTHTHITGLMRQKDVPPSLTQNWKDLASVFENLLGGSDATRRASSYLRALANGTLPENNVPPLTWHLDPGPPDVAPIAREEPHPVVLATLSPSAPLRSVWRRSR